MQFTVSKIKSLSAPSIYLKSYLFFPNIEKSPSLLLYLNLLLHKAPPPLPYKRGLREIPNVSISVATCRILLLIPRPLALGLQTGGHGRAFRRVFFYLGTPSGVYLFDHLLWSIFQSSITHYI